MLGAVFSVDDIRRGLAGYEPIECDPGGKGHAAVAAVVRDGDSSPEILLIERAARQGDPWSGHMAFPGGRIEAEDLHPRAGAVRETLEEVGVDLSAAEVLGRLDDMEGHHAAAPRMVISAFVFHLPDNQPLAPNYEVREAFWFPLPDLLDPDRHVDYEMRRFELANMPGLLVGHPERHIVWGLTYKFIERLLHIAGHPLPDRWGNLPEAVKPPRR
jgi:8-oxo-dGTP pyrophosphatase MutT (NUDIX family)